MTRTAEDGWLAFVPRDTVFIRDGRAFDAGSDGGAQGVAPGPSTIAGATGAAFGAEPTEVRGPLLARLHKKRWEPYLPVPLDVVEELDAGDPTVFRLRPETSPATTDLDDVAQWLAALPKVGTTAPLDGFLPGRILTEYLAGRLPAADGTPVEDLNREKNPLPAETHVGLARDAGRQVRTGFLYSARHLRPAPGWGFLAGCVLPPGWARTAAGPVALGGRGRLADVEEVAGVAWPTHPDTFPGGRVLLYLATPALWPGGWRPPLPPGAQLVAAATGEPQPIATTTPGPRWRDNRVLRWAVPAGSVYLLAFPDETQARTWAVDVHATAYGLDEKNRLRTAGFGIVLTGVWS